MKKATPKPLKNSPKPEKTLSDKVRSSLVLKLNFRMIRMLAAAFISFNLLFSILYFGVILWKAEEGAQQFLTFFGIPQVEAETQTAMLFGYDVTRVDALGKGVRLPDVIQERMPLEAADARRRITAPGLFPRMPIQERLEATAYHITFTLSGLPIQITYGLAGDIRVYLRLLLLVVGVQFLYLLGSLGENTKNIRKTLKPLADLAETARNLQQDVASLGADGSSLQHLAGAISTIDAHRLDRRIAVGSAQHELKDLAQAINDMLNRINQSYQSQVRFVSDASHELRTPISVIQGYVNLLDRWGKQDEKVMQESIDAIKAETENMQALVEQLLFLARGDNETMQLQKEAFDACDIATEIVREAQLIDLNHPFDISLHPPAVLEADRPLLKQAVRILMDNSIKYTPAGERISLKVFSENKHVMIQVQDNGIGIAPEDVSHIFDRFYRSDESRARKTGGAGLGLAIAKWIIERHDGHFEVISRVDIGTRTTVILPGRSVTDTHA